MKKLFTEIMVKGTRAVFFNFKTLVLLWMWNIGAALILALPVYYNLIDHLGNSLLSDKLAYTFDYNWYLQFRFLYQINLDGMLYTLLGVLLIYIIVQNFFMGGLIAIFNNPKKNHVVDFFYGGVKYWARFTKILIIVGLLVALAFLINDYIGKLITWIFEDTENQVADAILRTLRYLLLLFFIGMVTIIADYSRIILAVNDSFKILKSIGDSVRFIRKNFTRVFLLFLVTSAIGSAGAVIYNLVGGLIPGQPYYYLIILFILQQMLIIFRLLIRMLFCSTELLLYKDLNAEVINI